MKVRYICQDSEFQCYGVIIELEGDFWYKTYGEANAFFDNLIEVSCFLEVVGNEWDHPDLLEKL
ncbi:hypothetical protein MFLO_15346 [Listeria floridensis FSL S10-1187]|uniref:Phage protein n=1 Tax=Listeria floridensis FSL S10-1187 TaxID=1265817 RepID=A0ABN0RBI8_9LIST|nr:hypothetical protein MFLO_15346 [Listeria floridensis FSL S10-1187]